MSKIKPVTTGQTDGIAKMANEKGLSRSGFQSWIDEGEVSRLLDVRKMKEIAEGRGARIHIVQSWVRQDRPWDEAINAAGPDTPSDYNVRKVGHIYLPTGTVAETQEHVFLNYPNGDGNWDKALELGTELKLQRAVPRGVFAVGEQHPCLHRMLGVNPMYVVATTPCTFEGSQRACGVWWGASERKACLVWVSRFGYANDWFAFRKPSASDLKS